MLNHILIPLDGSKLAEHALRPVSHFLKPGGQITLLSVVSGDTGDLPRVGDVALDRYLEQIAARLRLEGFSAQVEIAAGDPADQIVGRAHKLGVELIVMGTHGRSGLEKLLYGSVTSKVLAITACPVLVIPNRVRQETPEAASAADTHLGWAG